MRASCILLRSFQHFALILILILILVLIFTCTCSRTSRVLAPRCHLILAASGKHRDAPRRTKHQGRKNIRSVCCVRRAACRRTHMYHGVLCINPHCSPFCSHSPIPVSVLRNASAIANDSITQGFRKAPARRIGVRRMVSEMLQSSIIFPS